MAKNKKKKSKLDNLNEFTKDDNNQLKQNINSDNTFLEHSNDRRR